jgi:hypothetical protein
MAFERKRAMAVLLGKTVVHKVAVNERGGVGLTACGVAFSLSDERYDPNGKFGDEGYLDWLFESRPDLRCRSFCTHCPNRCPAWTRNYKRREALRLSEERSA